MCKKYIQNSGVATAASGGRAAGASSPLAVRRAHDRERRESLTSGITQKRSARERRRGEGIAGPHMITATGATDRKRRGGGGRGRGAGMLWCIKKTHAPGFTPPHVLSKRNTSRKNRGSCRRSWQVAAHVSA